jgi:hypothetical protein
MKTAIQPSVAAALRQVMDRHGLPLFMAAFSGHSLTPERLRDNVPALSGTLAVLCQLFALGEPVDRRAAVVHLSRDLTEELLRYGILRRDGERISTDPLRLVFHFGALILCEPGRPGAEAHYGSDSVALRRLCQGLSGRVLDFGAGVGTQAISLAGPGSSALCIEKNRSLQELFEFNASLNGVRDRVAFMVGDTRSLDALDEQFDVVLCPPMMPVPAALPFPLAGNGGESGQELLLGVLAHANRILSEKGQCRFLATILGGENGPDLTCFDGLLAGRPGLDISLIGTYRASMSPDGLMFKSMVAAAQACGMAEADALSACAQFYGRKRASYLYFCLGNARRAEPMRRPAIGFSRHYCGSGSMWGL